MAEGVAMEFGALFDKLEIAPLWLIIGGFAAGFFVARRFSSFMPDLFKPDTSAVDIRTELAALRKELAELKAK